MAAVGSSTTLAGGNRSNSTFTAPSGISNGDYLLIVMVTGNNPAVTPTPPSGFTALSGFPVTMTSFGGDPYTVRLHAWRKIASGESGSYATSHSTCDTSGAMLRITSPNASPDTTTPQITNHAPGSGGNTITAPTITPGTDNAIVVYAAVNWDGFGSISPPTGTTPTFTEYLNETGGVIYIAAGPLATAGATGAKSVTVTQGDGRPWVAAHIVVESAASFDVALLAAMQPGFVRKTERPMVAVPFS